MSTDWATYRLLCERGDVLSRWLLERTAGLLEEAEQLADAEQLRAIAASSQPLPRPAGHRGEPETDFLIVHLELELARRIAEVVAQLAADSSRRLPDGRRLGGLATAWAAYVAWLREDQLDDSPAAQSTEESI